MDGVIIIDNKKITKEDLRKKLSDIQYHVTQEMVRNFFLQESARITRKKK